MKEIEIEKIDEFDEEKIELLGNVTGYKREAATLLLYLIEKKEGRSKDIEQSTDLRQSAVSVGMRQLINDGIVKVKLLRREIRGKRGRRERLCYLALSKNKLLALIDEKASAEIKKRQEELKKVKRLKQIVVS